MSDLPPPPIQNGLLFVYDALKPDEIAHHSVEAWVSSSQSARIYNHALRSRDGLPLLVTAQGRHVDGYLLEFTSPAEAYAAVRQYEPPKHYKWNRGGVQVQTEAGVVTANALLARKPNAGAEQENISSWSSGKDPVFTHGVPTAAGIFRSAPGGTWQCLFHVQAAYLLTWSAVERFSALMFGPAHDPTKRNQRLATVPDWSRLFRDADVPTGGRQVFDSRDPEDKIRIGEDGSNAWDYWYQVRSNLSHRGKGAHRDLTIVTEAFIDVHDVLRLLLLHHVPDIRNEWRLHDPDGEERQWRLRPARLDGLA